MARPMADNTIKTAKTPGTSMLKLRAAMASWRCFCSASSPSSLCEDWWSSISRIRALSERYFSAFFADTLYYSGQVEKSILAYQTVRDSQLDNKYQEDAAFRMIKAYEEIIDGMKKAGKITDPDIPVAGSPLNTLPNIQLSSHIAGAINDEYGRQGDFVIEEFERYVTGPPLLHAEDLTLLDRLA